MLKFQLATAQDLKEQAIIAGRRRFEEERKKRIFNSRQRILGVDYETIEQQVREKNARDEQERARDAKFINESLRQAEVLLNKERELNLEKVRINKEINDYRALFQKKEDTREFDLNDPKLNQKTLPARLGDNDVRLSISSAQKFLGEDTMAKERKKLQTEQQRSWLQQQIVERRQAEIDRERAEKSTMEALASRDRRAMELDEAERKSRREIEQATARFNARLASEQEYNRMEKKRQDEEDNLAVIYNNLTSDMLTENKDCSSNFGPTHKITSQYRGMTDTELRAFNVECERLAEDLRVRRTNAEIEAEKWNIVTNNLARATLLKEREIDRKQRALNLDVLEENRRLAEKQKMKIDYLDKIVYTNPPSKEYFAQFNTTTR